MHVLNQKGLHETARASIGRNEDIERPYRGSAQKILPKEVTERAKLHLLDTLAAMVSGSRLAPGERAIGYAKSLVGTRKAGVVGTRGAQAIAAPCCCARQRSDTIMAGAARGVGVVL